MKHFPLILGLLMMMNGIFWACGQQKIIDPNIPNTEQSALFSTKIGTHTLYLLSEGNHAGNSSILIGATAQMKQETIPADTFPNATNAFLLKIGTKNILIDAGYGTKLFENLASVGVSAPQIDIILITHMHGDHIGGLLKDQLAAFPNAELYIAQPEYDYWTSDVMMLKIAENRQGSFMNARNVINAYKEHLHLFMPENLENSAPTPLIENITAFAAYGHTPGHTVFQINDASNKLLIWGDLTHAMAIQMPYPQVAVTYDINPENAVIAREKVLQYVAQNQIPIAGMHIAFPAIGTIEKSNTGYQFIPTHH